MKVDVFAALFVLGNHSCLCTDKIPGVVPFLAALEPGWDAAFRSVLLGMLFQEWAFVVHTMLVLGPTPLVPWASPFCGTGESDFQENPDFHPQHERKRDIWRLSRDGDLRGGKCRFLISFSPLLLLTHAVINELEGCRAELYSCQPK